MVKLNKTSFAQQRKSSHYLRLNLPRLGFFCFPRTGVGPIRPSQIEMIITAKPCTPFF